MYTPEAFRVENRNEIVEMIRACGLATFVTNSAQGLVATPVPMIYAAEEGEHGALYAHISKANSQWKESLEGEALVIFAGANAYVTPSWYSTKAETGRVVPTWNYLAVHAYGIPEFFHEPDRLLDVVSRLTNLHEAGRKEPWSVADAPQAYIDGLLRAIVGIRIPVSRIEAKKKMSQNQPAENRIGVKEGLAQSAAEMERQVAGLISRETGVPIETE